jgi:hypothetical protein
MKRFPERTAHTWSLSMGSLLLALTLTGCATVPSWEGLPWSQFPAKVQAVVFEDATSLDRLHGVSWGNWTVSFGSSAPIAGKKRNPIFTSVIMIEISNLRCSNPVSGTGDCSILLNFENQGCFVGDYGDSTKRVTISFSIKCPTALRFE